MLGANLALAQEEETPPTIGDIQVEFLNLQNVSTQAIMAQIQLRVGMPYSQGLVDRSIRSLYRTQLFDFIEARPDPMPNNEVRITFIVQPKYRLQAINYEGNDKYSDRRLRSKTETRAGRALNERAIREDRDAILQYYRDKGFSRATVEYEIDRNDENGLAIVTYKIFEGPQLKIREVNFVGNVAYSTGDLRGEIETKKRRLWSFLTGTGRFQDSVLQDDLDTLRTFYANNGYLDVNIDEANVILDYPDDEGIIITIRVDEGRQYRVGEVTFEGNTLFDTPSLQRLVRLVPGDVFSPEKVADDLERMQDFYGAYGYLDTRVRPERRPNIETGAIDLNYVISESERFLVESVNIEGNTKTKSIVIIRELALSPGSVFNLLWMKSSEARLKNTRFFEEVRLTPEPTNIPGRRNLKVTVKEGRTGQFQFGAGFSSLESAVFFAELQQSNFDLFNYRSFFQGDGQKFRLRLSLGSESNEVVLSFEEPWLFEQRLAFGTELYRRQTEYQSTVYNEVRTGAYFYLRRRLFELVNGQVSYRLEQIGIDDVAANAPRVIRNEAGDRLASKIGFSLVRDTRNDLIFTTSGSRFQVSLEFAGLGGDTEYVSLETRNALFIPTFEFLDQTISVLFRAGTFWEYSDERVPFFDRWFLGGPDSLRGFDIRETGPREDIFTGTSGRFEPTGGNSYGFTSLEYTFKVAEPLRVAVFYDWGFVNEGDFDFNPVDYNDNWGIGIRLLVLGNPLRIDYGLPLTSTQFRDPNTGEVIYDNDRGGQFNFSFGTRF